MNCHVALCCMRAASAHAVQRLFGKPPAVVAAPADQSTLETVGGNVRRTYHVSLQ